MEVRIKENTIILMSNCPLILINYFHPPIQVPGLFEGDEFRTL